MRLFAGAGRQCCGSIPCRRAGAFSGPVFWAGLFVEDDFDSASFGAASGAPVGRWTRREEGFLTGFAGVWDEAGVIEGADGGRDADADADAECTVVCAAELCVPLRRTSAVFADPRSGAFAGVLCSLLVMILYSVVPSSHGVGWRDGCRRSVSQDDLPTSFFTLLAARPAPAPRRRRSCSDGTAATPTALPRQAVR